LQATLKAEDTLVLVTHKAEMLALVDRVIVIAGHQIVMDGPTAQVLLQLNAPAMEKAA
jgi:ATP-binding cassette subfamily C protein LapB